MRQPGKQSGTSARLHSVPWTTKLKGTLWNRNSSHKQRACESTGSQNSASLRATHTSGSTIGTRRPTFTACPADDKCMHVIRRDAWDKLHDDMIAARPCSSCKSCGKAVPTEDGRHDGAMKRGQGQQPPATSLRTSSRTTCVTPRQKRLETSLTMQRQEKHSSLACLRGCTTRQRRLSHAYSVRGAPQKCRRHALHSPMFPTEVSQNYETCVSGRLLTRAQRAGGSLDRVP